MRAICTLLCIAIAIHWLEWCAVNVFESIVTTMFETMWQRAPTTQGAQEPQKCQNLLHETKKKNPRKFLYNMATHPSPNNPIVLPDYLKVYA